MDKEFSYWNFIEKNHPRFSSDDRVLTVDIIFRYLYGDEVCEDDIVWMKDIGTKSDLLQTLVNIEKSLLAEALEAFYKRLLCLNEQVGIVLPNPQHNS